MEYIDTLAGRLEYARKNCPTWTPGRTRIVTQSEIATVLGVKRAAVSAIEKGITKNIKPNVLRPLADLLQVDTEWLITGNKEKAPKPGKPVTSSMQQHADSGMHNIEAISVIHAISGQILKNHTENLPFKKMYEQLKHYLNEL